MARKKKGLPINGWIAIDKPEGVTSTQVVGAVRWLTKAQKAGHGGTLDPLASGILPIALGEATKTVSYVMDGRKTYAFRVQWGVARTTDDREGEISETHDHRPTKEAVLAAIPAFVGEIQQIPPIYSALKIDGERAYDLARAGAEIELKARPVVIHSLALLDMPDADHADFVVRCGKGTYIRSLARDLARAVGTVGHVVLLRRTACGPFDETNAIPLDKFKELGDGPALRAYLLPIKTALDDIPALALTEAEVRRFQCGQPLPIDRLADSALALTLAENSDVRAMDGQRVVALARISGGELCPVRVLNLQPLDTGDHDVDYSGT